LAQECLSKQDLAGGKSTDQYFAKGIVGNSWTASAENSHEAQKGLFIKANYQCSEFF